MIDAEQLRSQAAERGFPEIRTNQLAPSWHNDEHSHPFDVLALVLDGEITLTVDGKARRYRAGDEFSMKAGCKHVEDAGPKGVRYLVGRRPA